MGSRPYWLLCYTCRTGFARTPVHFTIQPSPQPSYISSCIPEFLLGGRFCLCSCSTSLHQRSIKDYWWIRDKSHQNRTYTSPWYFSSTPMAFQSVLRTLHIHVYLTYIVIQIYSLQITISYAFQFKSMFNSIPRGLSSSDI